MKYLIYNLFLGLILFGLGCSSSENIAQQDPIINERISLNINEAVYFDFVKTDTVWTGELTTYTLNESGEKVVNNEYVSARDSSWNDFDAFVQFLNIYEIEPQNEVEGWVPNSAELPRRVYNFEVFNGDTTRSFSYQDPINDLQDFWQAQNLLTFVTFIRNDLRWVEREKIEQ
jgi:hypothetical protein